MKNDNLRLVEISLRCPSTTVRIHAGGLKAACDGGLGGNAHGRLVLQMAITNNDRPVTIPLDDLAGGFRIKVGWVRV